MSSTNWISQAFQHLLYLVPSLIVIVIGLALSVSLAAKSRRAAALLCTGCLILLVNSLVYPFALRFLVARMSEHSGGVGSMGYMISGLGMVQSVIHAIALAVIFAAVMADRSPKTAATPYYPPPSEPSLPRP